MDEVELRATTTEQRLLGGQLALATLDRASLFLLLTCLLLLLLLLLATPPLSALVANAANPRARPT